MRAKSTILNYTCWFVIVTLRLDHEWLGFYMITDFIIRELDLNQKLKLIPDLHLILRQLVHWSVGSRNFINRV